MRSCRARSSIGDGRRWYGRPRTFSRRRPRSASCRLRFLYRQVIEVSWTENIVLCECGESWSCFTIAALAIGAAEAAYGAVPVLLRTPGAELVELRGGNGRAAVTRRGSLLVNDRVGPAPDRRPRRTRSTKPQRALSEPCTPGEPAYCRDSGPQHRLLYLVGRGWRTLAGHHERTSDQRERRGEGVAHPRRRATEGDPGRYRIAGGDWRRWPRAGADLHLDRK